MQQTMLGIIYASGTTPIRAIEGIFHSVAGTGFGPASFYAFGARESSCIGRYLLSACITGASGGSPGLEQLWIRSSLEL